MKILITTYTFNASAKTITFGGYGSISLENVLLVTNVTDNIIIYNFSDPTKGGTVATNVLTLAYDTTSMSNGDKLQIFYDDATATQLIGTIVPGTAATNLGKAEDAAHASGDTGVMALAVRQDSEAAMAGNSGDYIPLMTDSTGKLRTSAAGTVAHDAVDAGNPVKIGGKALTSAPADVASGDRVDAFFDLKGRQKVDGSDVTQPVSAASLPLPTGASTSALQTTGNTSLSTIAGAVAGTEMQVDVLTLPALPAGTNNIGDVDVLSSALPTGAATSALQTTGNSTLSAIDTKLDGTLDVAIISGGGGGVQYTDADTDATPTGTLAMWRNSGTNAVLAAADNAPLPAYDAAVEAAVNNVADDTNDISSNTAITATHASTIAGAVAGTEMQVDVLTSALPTGASTSAKQDTGNTSVASIDTKTPALGQALAAASVPVILPSATITTLTPPAAITGFATSTKQDSLLTELQLKADLTETQPVSLASVPSHAVTNAGTFPVQATGDIASGATDSGNPVKIGGKNNTTQPTLTDGQRGDLQVDTRANLKVTPYFANGVNPFAGQADNADAVAVSSTTNKLGVLARMSVFNGTTWDRLSGDTTGINVKAIVGAIPAGNNNIGDVDIATLPVAFNSGATSATTQRVILATDTTVPNVTGNIAHDGADSGNPVKNGNKATTSLAGVTLVATGDRTDAYAGVDGVPIVRNNSNLEDIVNGNTSNTDGTSTSLIAASGAGVKTYLTDITITNTSANNIYVEIKDGSTAKWTFPVPANAGVTHNFTTPLAGTANTAWNFDPSTATTTIFCSANGFKSKV